MQCSAAVRCSAVQCSAVLCCAMQCSAVQFSTSVQCTAVQCSAVSVVLICRRWTELVGRGNWVQTCEPGRRRGFIGKRASMQCKVR